MATAFVLITCDLGYEEQIIEELKHLSDVNIVYSCSSMVPPGLGKPI